MIRSHFPDDVWRRADVLDMCRNRDAGALLRLANSSRFRISQGRLAHWIGTEAADVSRLINGKAGQVVRLDRWERIADGLNMPDHARIALGLAPRRVRSSTSGTHPQTRQVLDSAIPELNRAERGEGSASGDQNEFDDVMDRLDAALAQPRYADRTLVLHLTRLLAAQRRLEDAAGARRLIGPGLAQFEVVSRIIPHAPPRIRHDLLRLAGESSQLLGWMHEDIGDSTRARA